MFKKILFQKIILSQFGNRLSSDSKIVIIRLLDLNGKIIGTKTLGLAEEYAKKINCVLVKTNTNSSHKYEEYKLKKKIDLVEKKIDSKSNSHSFKKVQLNDCISLKDLDFKINSMIPSLKKKIDYNVSIFGRNEETKNRLLDLFKEKLGEGVQIKQVVKNENNLKFKVVASNIDALKIFEGNNKKNLPENEDDINEESNFNDLEDLIVKNLKKKK